MPRKSTASAAPKTPKAPKASAVLQTRMFVLDTNVLLHDPQSVLRFREHDVFVPFVTLEELDNKKAGREDINRNARQATRLLDEIVSQEGYDVESGFPLKNFNGGHALGNLFVQRKALPFLADEHIRKNDNLYLSVLNGLQAEYPGREVVLVTKDLNLRIKARAMGFTAEDYLHDHVVEDADLLSPGLRRVSEEEFEAWGDRLESWKEGKAPHYRIPRGACYVNEFLVFPDERLYRVIEVTDETAVLQGVIDTSKDKNSVMGICTRNEVQTAAMALLLDPEVDIVALLGQAGTGKTMLALAAAMRQVIHDEYDRILFTRATIPVGEEIGFLPGTEEEKVSPWLGALFDNIDVLAENAGSDIEGQKVRDIAKEAIEIKAITFMRGRTFHRKFVILDEAQNLTPKQMKTLVTRAGDGTKYVVLGNLAQIDSPYLSETSSGLAYLVERFRGWQHFGSLILEKGERSRLANAANERL